MQLCSGPSCMPVVKSAVKALQLWTSSCVFANSYHTASAAIKSISRNIPGMAAAGKLRQLLGCTAWPHFQRLSPGPPGATWRTAPEMASTLSELTQACRKYTRGQHRLGMGRHPQHGDKQTLLPIPAATRDKERYGARSKPCMRFLSNQTGCLQSTGKSLSTRSHHPHQRLLAWDRMRSCLVRVVANAEGLGWLVDERCH